MEDFASSFERLMALFRYRGLDQGALVPSSNATMEALIDAGQKVARDLEDLARRQAQVIETSTRQLMGNAQALARPDQFKEASETNLKTLVSAAETTMGHLGELAELLVKFNTELMSTMNQGMIDTMRGAESGRGAEPGRGAAPTPAPTIRAIPVKTPRAKRPRAKAAAKAAAAKPAATPAAKAVAKAPKRRAPAAKKRRK